MCKLKHLSENDRRFLKSVKIEPWVCECQMPKPKPPVPKQLPMPKIRIEGEEHLD